MSEVMLAFRGVTKSFGAQAVLRGLDLEVGRGEVLFLVGTSGVGKSVAIKQVVGLERPDGGEIWFDGERVDGLDEAAFYRVRRRCALVLQRSTLFDSLTLAENVALPLRRHQRRSWRQALTEARARLAEVHLEALADAYPAELGDGTRKRAAIARALTLAPTCVLFDEPTTGLDPVSARRVDQLIRRLADERGVTCVVVSHDLTSMFNVADRVALLYQGRVHAAAAPAELRASPDAVVQQFIHGRSQGPMETPGF